MLKAREFLARYACRGFCGTAWAYCALVSAAVATLLSGAGQALAEGEGSAVEAAAAVEAAPAEGAVAEAAEPATPDPEEAARAAAKERSDAAREIRQLHSRLIRARAAAVADDPEIGRLEQRAKALEAEAKRVRTEMDERISKVPDVVALQAELDAAEAKFRSLGDAGPGRGPNGSRRIRRKPDAVPAQE